MKAVHYFGGSMEELVTDSFLFAQIRRDVAYVYDLYVDHVGKSMGKIPIPSTYQLTAAFACLFMDLKLVSGTTLFTSEKKYEDKVLRFGKKLPHHWLSWRDDYHVIDVLPSDGKFAISVPQAVIQTDMKRRFFPQQEIFHPELDSNNRYHSMCGVEDIAATLDSLREKVPF